MKSNLLYILLLVGLFGCLIFDLVIQSSFSYLAFCYFVLFCFVAIFLIVRGFVYKIDTNLYFGILLLISPIVQTLIYFGIKNYSYYCVGVFLPLTLASLVVWRYFKNKRHQTLFVLFLGEIFIFLLPFCLTNISFWYLIIMAIVWFACVVCLSVLRHKKQPKKS